MTRRERLERKLEKREAWAESRDRQARTEFGKADLSEGKSGIPLGQPILIGHHSERRHRRAIERADNAMRRGVEAQDMAEHHRSKAAGLAAQLDRSIFSDDPDAVEALEAKAAAIDAEVERMKAINKEIRKGDGWQKRIQPPLTEAEGRELIRMAKFHWGSGPFKGFPAYALSNRRANARRLRLRIADVKRRQERTEKAESAAEGVLIERSPSFNWCQVTFAEKPDRSILDALKSAGYRWSEGSWSGPTSKLPAEVAALASGAEAQASEKPVPEEVTCWRLWECDKGNRWITAIRPNNANDPEEAPCNFSGCESGHMARVVKVTIDPETATDWFRRV